MADLRTRDGNVVKEIGSWEREQLDKSKKFDPPIRISKGRGRKPFDIEKNPMLYIGRCEPKNGKSAYWQVRIVIDGTKLSHKYFSDSTCGGKDNALIEAKNYRDNHIARVLNKENNAE